MRARRLTVTYDQQNVQLTTEFRDVEFEVEEGCVFIRQDERSIGQGLVNIKRTVIPLRLVMQMDADSDPEMRR